MKNIKALSTALLLAGILGLGATPLMADIFSDEDIIIDDFDPSDDIHGD